MGVNNVSATLNHSNNSGNNFSDDNCTYLIEQNSVYENNDNNTENRNKNETANSIDLTSSENEKISAQHTESPKTAKLPEESPICKRTRLGNAVKLGLVAPIPSVIRKKKKKTVDKTLPENSEVSELLETILNQVCSSQLDVSSNDTLPDPPSPDSIYSEVDDVDLDPNYVPPQEPLDAGSSSADEFEVQMPLPQDINIGASTRSNNPANNNNNQSPCPRNNVRINNTMHIVFPNSAPIRCTEPDCDFTSIQEVWSHRLRNLKRHLEQRSEATS